MKKTVLLLLSLATAGISMAQIAGNSNYQTRISYPSGNIDVGFSNSFLTVSVKGLANVKADAYVAVFSVNQVGRTAAEVNNLTDRRIAMALENYRGKPGFKTFTDMISLVPLYEYEVEKKLFSKDTYNEIPAGFQLQKNIHIQFTDPAQMNRIISDFAQAEIYDLVRVDYFSEKLGEVKKDLRRRAAALLREKLTDQETLLGKELDNLEKRVADGFQVRLPAEMYASYSAYSSATLGLKKPAAVNHAEKSRTLYYQPVADKEFDFVIDPIVLEPVIQVMYEVELTIDKPQNQTQTTKKQYILVTPAGEMRNLEIN